MANPFDEALGKEKTDGKDQEKKTNKDSISISFSLNKRMVERAVYILIILALLTFILVDPVCRCSVLNPGTCKVLASASDESNKQESSGVELKVQEEREEETKETIKEEEEEQQEEEEEEIEQLSPEPNTVASGTVDLEVENIDYVKDADDNNKPVKMKSITFLISNGWKDFKPRIDVLWYDKDSNDVMKEKIRASKTYREVKKGTSVRYSIFEFDSTFFDPSNRAETIVMKLIDADTGTVKKTTSLTIS